MHSHHSHSGQFCKHAKGKLLEVVEEAIRQRFLVYGLTEHVPRYRVQDLYPEEAGISPEDLNSTFMAFLDEAHRLKSFYESRITLLVGLETEFISPIDLANLDTFLQNNGHRIEYLVGSVHHVNGFPIDFDVPTFELALRSFAGEGSLQMEAYLSGYLDAQFELMARFKPEIIGHIDLCRLFMPNLCFADYPIALKKLDRNINLAVGYGGMFEVNAAAFRKGWSTAYPGRDVIELIISRGGRFTLSDDSHGPHAVGMNYDRTAEYLLENGVKELWFLRRNTANSNGRRLEACKVEGKWWEHGFWENKRKHLTVSSEI